MLRLLSWISLLTLHGRPPSLLFWEWERAIEIVLLARECRVLAQHLVKSDSACTHAHVHCVFVRGSLRGKFAMNAIWLCMIPPSLIIHSYSVSYRVSSLSSARRLSRRAEPPAAECGGGGVGFLGGDLNSGRKDGTRWSVFD